MHWKKLGQTWNRGMVQFILNDSEAAFRHTIDEAFVHAFVPPPKAMLRMNQLQCHPIRLRPDAHVGKTQLTVDTAQTLTQARSFSALSTIA